MIRFANLTLNGISNGMIYAAFALSLVLIWRATRVLNFAQGGMAILSTYIAGKLISESGSYWIGLVGALAFGLVLGALVERVLLRPVENGPPLNPVIVTLGLLVFLEAISGMFFGVVNTSFPFHFDIRGYRLDGTTLLFSPFNLYVVVAVAVVLVLLLVLFRFTGLGLTMRAAAFEPEVSRLLGVRVGRLLTLGWALAAVAGSLAGVLSGPPFISPFAFDSLLVFGFTAAVLGGLDSPIGAVVGGLVLGIVLSYVAGYENASLQPIAAFAILIVVLMVKPAGLFTRVSTRRV